MEKSRSTRKEQFGNRLLKIFKAALFFSFIVLQNGFAITPQEIRNLVIRPEENVFFTNQELKYVLEIPGVDLSDVQTQLQPMKDGVTCISSRRLDYFTNDDSTGARIEFWFTFRDTGTGEIPPLITKIKGYTYYLPFEKIQVYENPKTIAPRIDMADPYLEGYLKSLSFNISHIISISIISIIKGKGTPCLWMDMLRSKEVGIVSGL